MSETTEVGLIDEPGSFETDMPTASRAVSVPAVSDKSFPARVAVLLRSRPLSEAVTAAERQDWPVDVYDVASFALAAIDVVIAQQGFDEEATYEEVVAALVGLARRAAPERPGAEHAKVAAFTVDQLLNRSNREAEFTYRISDYTADSGGHMQREVRFRLLIEREDPNRGEIVLNATRDAINALIGGLEFDVEDEQVANEILLERQLAKGAFDAAERAAVRARLLSVRLSDDLDRLLKETRRDLRAVEHEWASTVPARLDEARDHIQSRLEAEHRLRSKISESLEAADPGIAESAGRINALLAECQRRHEGLHQKVITSRSVFLDEQDRQSFRPPILGYLPDLGSEVLRPLLRMPTAPAQTVLDRWLTDIGGPRAPRLPRLSRLVTDLLTIRDNGGAETATVTEGSLEAPDQPLISPELVDAARAVVVSTELPARLSTIIAACYATYADPSAADSNMDPRAVAEIAALAALWCYAPDDSEPGDPARQDLAARVYGPRAAVDSDGAVLHLPGWDGDDLIVAPFADALATADPTPVTDLPQLTVTARSNR